MAIEVKDQRYHFLSAVLENDLTDIQFRYNPLHDIESTWWVAVCQLLTNRPRNDESDPSAQIKEVTSLFTRHAEKSNRIDFFRRKATFFRVGRAMPVALEPLWTLLDKSRQVIKTAYENAETKYPPNIESLEIHENVFSLFEEMGRERSHHLKSLLS
jgi:hypothetical protein